MTSTTSSAAATPCCCEGCGNVQATCFCTECNCYFCESCSSAVHSLNVFKCHERIPVEKEPVPEPQCSEHPHEKLTLFCNDCQGIF